ncbi:hypothetical protein T06_946, partial [Trichinella sp. T6]
GDRAGAEATAPVTPGRATRSRASERACDGKARRDKPLCRGLTFNRSQRGSCSATYETPTQKQVVYNPVTNGSTHRPRPVIRGQPKIRGAMVSLRLGGILT